MRKYLWRSFPGILAAILVLAAPLAAQTKRPLIELNSFNAEGLGEDEAQLIGSLFQSYLSDFGEVSDYREGAAPDYIVSGNIYSEEDKFRFVLEIQNTAVGVSSTLTLDIRSKNELALRTGSLVKAAFSPEMTLFQPVEADPGGINMEQVIGMWRGEEGIDFVRLYSSGQGLAVFSSGARMNLSWDIAGDTLRIRQTSPLSERFYPNVSPERAAEIMEKAEPLRWELGLYGNRNTLRGERIFTAVPEQGVQLLYGQRESVEWARSIR
jgi:hypothetical protein